jgi:hypothetical protein
VAQITVDDLDLRTPADHTNVDITDVDGTRYEIDLSNINHQILTQALQPFILAARRANTTAPATTTRKRKTATRTEESDNLGKEERAEIRRWAEQEGIKCPERGRIPGHVLAAWNTRDIDEEPEIPIDKRIKPLFHATSNDDFKQRLHAWCMTKGIPTNSKGRGTAHGVEKAYVSKFQKETGVLPPVQ